LLPFSIGRGGLGLDICVLDEEIERLGSDDIAGQRHDLTAAVQLFRELLGLPLVRGGQGVDLGADLVGRDLDALGTGDGLQDQVRRDGPDGVVAGVRAEPVFVPALALQHLCEGQPAPLCS
jgi:hypothetical protein